MNNASFAAKIRRYDPNMRARVRDHPRDERAIAAGKEPIKGIVRKVLVVERKSSISGRWVDCWIIDDEDGMPREASERDLEDIRNGDPLRYARGHAVPRDCHISEFELDFFGDEDAARSHANEYWEEWYEREIHPMRMAEIGRSDKAGVGIWLPSSHALPENPLAKGKT